MTKHPTVFISYSHDSDKHDDKVLDLADRLRRDGIDCTLDQYETSPPENWPKWMDRHIANDDFVILIFTKNYYDRVMGEEESGKGQGVKWESTLTYQYIYDDDSENKKFIPVLFKTGKVEFIPRPLRGATRYNVDTEPGYEDLYRRLTNQPRHTKAVLGKLVKLPAKKRREDFRAAQTAAVSLTKLPSTSADLFGRDKEKELLNAAWDNSETNIISLEAFGGVGKTALVNRWLLDMGQNGYRGAERVLGWSFYSQGTKKRGQASADIFLAAALKWFGDLDPAEGSPWTKGERLAGLINETRTLLILDGVEPLQNPPGDQGGKLKDQGLESLLKSLARHNNGLAVISTRLKVADIQQFEGRSVKSVDLENLSPSDGAIYLDHLGVKGSQKELEEASREFDGHALALSLLGGLLKDVYQGDVRCWREVGPLEDDAEQGGHSKRVIRSYEIWLGDGPELAVLRLMGLFDRPAEAGAIAALRAAPAIPKLTDALIGLTDRKWRQTLAKLRRARLISETAPNDTDTLDTHPLVREHFGEQLRERNLTAWEEAHSRLFEYYREQAPNLPETLEEMTPLFAAVAHGCQAGRYEEALEKVYWAKIRRGNKNFCVSQLGAISADLAALSGFFEQLWNRPVHGLTDAEKGFALNWAGFRLRALGRLEESAKPAETSLEAAIARRDWSNAARGAGNISELYLLRGDITQSLKYVGEGVEFADRSKELRERRDNRATWADALHQAGRLSEAEPIFWEAEKLQKEKQPQYRFLYSLNGFRFCDLLLSKGDISEVLTRATLTLEWAKLEHGLLSIAMDNLALGRAHLLLAKREKTDDYAESESHLNVAVDGLRQAGQQEFIILGLLARAELRRVTGKFKLAHADLEEAISIATRSGMRLLEADCQLEYARFYLAQKEKGKASESLDQGGKMVKEMEYHRRDEEVEELRKKLG